MVKGQRLFNYTIGGIFIVNIFYSMYIYYMFRWALYICYTPPMHTYTHAQPDNYM